MLYGSTAQHHWELSQLLDPVRPLARNSIGVIQHAGLGVEGDGSGVIDGDVGHFSLKVYT